MIGGIAMMYPVFSYDDGTEVTASSPEKDGSIILYVEHFDAQRDEFINATFRLPGVVLISSNGYSEKELDAMSREYKAVQDDIMNYVMDKVTENV